MPVSTDYAETNRNRTIHYGVTSNPIVVISGPSSSFKGHSARIHIIAGFLRANCVASRKAVSGVLASMQRSYHFRYGVRVYGSALDGCVMRDSVYETTGPEPVIFIDYDGGVRGSSPNWFGQEIASELPHFTETYLEAISVNLFSH